MAQNTDAHALVEHAWRSRREAVERLEALRVQSGLTHAEVARRANLGERRVHAVTSGLGLVTEDELIRIGAALGVAVVSHIEVAS